jgi:ABC-type transporter Mla MlaB component
MNPRGDPETLRLEGRIAGPWVEELARVTHTALVESPRVVLDLTDVTFVDASGVTLLRVLRGRQAEIRGSSGFVSSLLNGG